MISGYWNLSDHQIPLLAEVDKYFPRLGVFTFHWVKRVQLTLRCTGRSYQIVSLNDPWRCCNFTSSSQNPIAYKHCLKRTHSRTAHCHSSFTQIWRGGKRQFTPQGLTLQFHKHLRISRSNSASNLKNLIYIGSFGIDDPFTLLCELKMMSRVYIIWHHFNSGTSYEDKSYSSVARFF